MPDVAARQPSDEARPEAVASAQPIRIRARLKDGVAEVHVLMPHPMETGIRTDAAGQPIAAHYITDIDISVSQRPVLSAKAGFALSQDPLLFFRFNGARRGDPITVAWTDNRGQRRTDEALIS